MKSSTTQPEKAAKNIGLLGLGLCVACCTLPVIGIFGGGTILTAVSLYAEKLSLGLLALSLTLFVIWYFRKRKAPACSIDSSCKEEKPESKIN